MCLPPAPLRWLLGRYLKMRSLRGTRPGPAAIQKGPLASSRCAVGPSPQAEVSRAGLRSLSWASHFTHTARAEGSRAKGAQGMLLPSHGSRGPLQLPRTQSHCQPERAEGEGCAKDWRGQVCVFGLMSRAEEPATPWEPLGEAALAWCSFRRGTGQGAAQPGSSGTATARPRPNSRHHSWHLMPPRTLPSQTTAPTLWNSVPMGTMLALLLQHFGDLIIIIICFSKLTHVCKFDMYSKIWFYFFKTIGFI